MVLELSEYIVSEDKGKYVVVWLNRPEKLNAFTLEMWRRLGEVVENYCDRGKIVVLRGRGRAFSAGDDIPSMYSLNTVDSAKLFFGELYKAVGRVVACREPIVSVVDGYAFGGGAEILLVSDVVIATSDSVFSYPEGLIGLIPPVLLTLGSYSIGWRKARALALLASRLSAEEALRLGIVDVVVDKDKLESVVEEVIEELSRIPPAARSSIKKISLEAIKHLSRAVEEAVVEELSRLVLSSEAKRRMKLFIEKKYK